MTPIRTILCPTDFSRQADEAWAHAQYLAGVLGSNLHLLHVIAEPVVVVPEASLAMIPVPTDTAALFRSAEAALSKLSDESSVRVVHRRVRIGAAPREILDHAGEIRADLIVLGTHGRTGLAHLLLGSVAEGIVRHAGCAVLTVRAAAAGRATAVPARRPGPLFS